MKQHNTHTIFLGLGASPCLSNPAPVSQGLPSLRPTWMAISPLWPHKSKCPLNFVWMMENPDCVSLFDIRLTQARGFLLVKLPEDGFSVEQRYFRSSVATTQLGTAPWRAGHEGLEGGLSMSRFYRLTQQVSLYALSRLVERVRYIIFMTALAFMRLSEFRGDIEYLEHHIITRLPNIIVQ